MAVFQDAVDACRERAKRGEPVAPWMAKHLDRFFEFYAPELHHHHDNEERIAFPFLQERVTIPPGMRDDHKSIMQATADIAAATRGLQDKSDAEWQAVALESLSKHVAELYSSLQEHFKEEEEGTLVLMRHHFTAEEWKPVEARILEGIKPISLAFLLDGLGSDAERVAWCQEIAGIPVPVIKMVMMPAYRKYTWQYPAALKDVVQGTRSKRGCFGCF